MTFATGCCDGASLPGIQQVSRHGERRALQEREYSGEGELAILDETKQSLEKRIARLQIRRHGAGRRIRRPTRVTSSPGIAVVEEDPDTQIVVHANFVLYRSRGESSRTLMLAVGTTFSGASIAIGKSPIGKIFLPQHVLAAKNVSNFFCRDNMCTLHQVSFLDRAELIEGLDGARRPQQNPPSCASSASSRSAAVSCRGRISASP